MNEKNNNYTATLVLLAIIIVGGAVYFLVHKGSGVVTTNPDQTATTTDTTPSTPTYTNTQYGLSVTLPGGWAGYTVVTSTWQGYSLINNGTSQQIVQTGPYISIRNPQWTEAVPRQDIPVYVFTIAQWNAMQADAFHIGAAPIGPSELARNANYVFALPARYNFAYLPGYEEVQAVIDAKSVTAF